MRKIVCYALSACFYFIPAAPVFAEFEPSLLPEPLTQGDFSVGSKQSIALGQLLFFDPILSGNNNISCASCHHPEFSSGDGVSLSIGEGGIGLGPARHIDTSNPAEQRIGRNAPALFNLGAYQFTSLFHDGRLEVDSNLPGGIRTPLGREMVEGFNSILSAQAMFPVASPDEMAGHYSENEISSAIRKGQISGENGAWNKIAQRIRNNSEYAELFQNNLGHIKQAKDIQFTDIANAIADFIAYEWQAIESPFDGYLKGGVNALTPEMTAGMQLFYGKAGCSTCHSGALQTDHSFHAIAVPQFGPGKTARFESKQIDTGRFRVTGIEADAYKFRTPSLRNIALTAPYGHTGAFKTLREILLHHLNPLNSLRSYDYAKLQTSVEDSFGALDPVTAEEIKNIADANELKPGKLNEKELAFLEAFLHALTDKRYGRGRLGRPDSVPSGLTFD